MHSSLSFSSNRDRDKQGSKKPDFQKDIIMPNIYASENFEIIKNNSYPVRKQRKVVTAKKAKVHSVVQAIISKKTIEVSKKVANYTHRLSKPANKVTKKPMPTLSTLEPDTLVMDFDERLNEKAMYYEEQTTIAKEKMREVMERVKGTDRDSGMEMYNQEVTFYLTSLSPPKKPVPISVQEIYFNVEKPSKDAKGFVEQQEQRQRRWQLKNRKQIATRTQMSVKPRPKTAQTSHKKASQRPSTPDKAASVSHYTSTLFRSNSLMNTKLNRFSVGREVLENVKTSLKNQSEKDRMRDLFERIQGNCLANTMEKGKLVGELNKLGMMWKTEKEFTEGRPAVTVLTLSNDSFKLLRSIRKQQSQLTNLDNKFLNDEPPAPAHP